MALEALSTEQKELLDTVDNLRNHGIDDFLDSPQIVVIGDQSSGKSSVLQAIAHVPFPIKDGLCTRFATELVLRCDQRVKKEATIQPAPSSHNREVQSFKETGFDMAELPTIIAKAEQKMLADGASFSEDVLRIELHSPDLPNLTLVDLPGFYRSEDETSATGRQVVDRLAERYMCPNNSIILAIVSATDQVSLQKVLSKVREHDRNTERTFGIITKPDHVVPGSGDEKRLLCLVKNIDVSHKLSLGWHVLRNRTETENDYTERDFFDSEPWSLIPSRNRGVVSLRAKLSKTLLQHIKKKLPTLMQSIEENLNERKKRLTQLGSPRRTPNEIRSYLDHIASQLERLSRDALDGNYTDKFFGELYQQSNGSPDHSGRIRKLRALIRDLNHTFAYVLETKGASYIIRPRDIDSSDYNKGEGRTLETSGLPQFLQVLADQYKFSTPREVSIESICADVERFSSENRGNEFPGTSNDRVAMQLFQHQMKPWEEIAKLHLKLVLDTSKVFIETLLKYIVGPSSQTFTALLNNTVYPFFNKKESQLKEKLQELLHHYKRGHPQPLDTEFRALLADRCREKLPADSVRYMLAKRPDLFTEAAKEELNKAQHPLRGNGRGAAELLIDKAETYYEVRSQFDRLLSMLLTTVDVNSNVHRQCYHPSRGKLLGGRPAAYFYHQICEQDVRCRAGVAGLRVPRCPTGAYRAAGGM